MTDKDALIRAKRALAPYRRGNHVSSGASEITTAVADAIKAAANFSRDEWSRNADAQQKALSR